MKIYTENDRESLLIDEALSLHKEIRQSPHEAALICENWQNRHEDQIRSIKEYRNLCAKLATSSAHKNLTKAERIAALEAAEIAANVLNMPASFAPFWLSAMGFLDEVAA